MKERTRAVEKRNFLCLLSDFTFFGTGASFASQITVLPAFLATLTSSGPIIGLSSTIATGAWLLPQLFAANSLAGRVRRKPFVILPATIGRILFLVLGPMVFLLRESPGAVLVVFLCSYGMFFLLDGIASIAWLEILARTLSATTRARLIGIGQAATGIAGIGAGVLVGVILTSDRLRGTAGYSVIFLISGVLFALSLISFLPLKEEPEPSRERSLPWPDYFRALADVLRKDRDFRRALVVVTLVSLGGLATPFYVIHGLTALSFPEISVGIFTSAQVAGGIGSGLLMGWLGERRGTRSVLRLWGLLAVAAPLIALGLSCVGSGVPGVVLMYAYAVVFILVGAQANSVMAGFVNYVLELAPAERRSMYIGCANTLGSVSLAAPLLGGWMLDAGGSWPLLFTAAAASPVAGLILSLRLVEPRQRVRAAGGRT